MDQAGGHHIQKKMVFKNCFLSAQKKHTYIYTDRNEDKIFLIHKEIQTGAVAESYMRKGFLIYEEMHKYLVIFEEAVI